MRRKPFQFSLARLMCAMAEFGLAAWLLHLCMQSELAQKHPPPEWFGWAAYFGSFALAGAGIGTIIQRPATGAGWGLWIAVALALALAVAFALRWNVQ